ncbi:cytochrome P450 [Actinoplanes sp. NPDC048796]|uniref:cytochrome P450 n=1 Tax=Actinoplanes sp. NPDC048796 TaxID=3155640 RepID=UPI0033E44B49
MTLERGGVVDVASEYAYPLPFRVICALLGVSWHAEERLGDWFTVLAAGSVNSVAVFAEASGTMLSFLRETIGAKRREPGDDLITALIQARDGDDRLTEDELVSMMYVLFIAGHETTASLITNSVLALLRNPGQLALVHDRRDLIDATVEGTLRYDGVVQATMPAVATETFTLGGQLVQQGDVVAVSPLTASFATGAEPDRFDVTREAPHLGFGHGIHYCIGAPLARLEARIALRHLIEWLPAVQLEDDNLERLPSIMFNRLAALRIHMRERS